VDVKQLRRIMARHSYELVGAEGLRWCGLRERRSIALTCMVTYWAISFVVAGPWLGLGMEYDGVGEYTVAASVDPRLQLL
jgi:hypothetical protein